MYFIVFFIFNIFLLIKLLKLKNPGTVFNNRSVAAATEALIEVAKMELFIRIIIW